MKCYLMVLMGRRWLWVGLRVALKLKRVIHDCVEAISIPLENFLITMDVSCGFGPWPFLAYEEPRISNCKVEHVAANV